MKIVQEEIFGPVGVLIKFEDEEDVIRQANDTLYGLAAAVFTQDISRALETARKLKSGTAWINYVDPLEPNAPFGGLKLSGSSYYPLLPYPRTEHDIDRFRSTVGREFG